MTNEAPRPSALVHQRVGILAAGLDDVHEWRQRDLRTILLRADNLHAVFADPPHALVVDYKTMDVVSLDQCWHMQRTLGTPLVVVAEGMESRQVVELLRRGASDVISEPATSALVAARVSALLRRLPTSGPQLLRVVQIGRTEIDLHSRRVRTPSGEAGLSPTEFAVLLALLRADGRTCTRAELDAVLGHRASDSSQGNLRIVISRLRQKLGDRSPKPEIIVNHWGVGYRLVISGPDSPAGVNGHLSRGADPGGGSQRSVG